MPPSGSSASPRGRFRRAGSGPGASPLLPNTPTYVVTAALARSMRRTAPLSESATNRLPLPSATMAIGRQEVERQRSLEDVVLVILRRRRDAFAPARRAERPAIEPVQQHQPALRRVDAGDERRQRRLAAAGAALDEDAVADAHLERH